MTQLEIKTWTDLVRKSNLNNWPADALYLFRERLNIRQFDGGQPEDEARIAAELEVREQLDRQEREQ